MNIIKLETKDEPNIVINLLNVAYIEKANAGTRYFFVGNPNPLFVEVPFKDAAKELEDFLYEDSLY